MADGVPDDFVPTTARQPAPCDGCQQRPRCAVELLACTAFANFVGGQRWRHARRDPTAARFARLYAADDKPATDDPRRGLRPVTLEKLDALRALRGHYASRTAVFAAVRLSPTYWERIAARDPALAAHVVALTTTGVP